VRGDSLSPPISSKAYVGLQSNCLWAALLSLRQPGLAGVLLRGSCRPSPYRQQAQQSLADIAPKASPASCAIAATVCSAGLSRLGGRRFTATSVMDGTCSGLEDPHDLVSLKRGARIRRGADGALFPTDRVRLAIRYQTPRNQLLLDSITCVIQLR
jgi:hypothetical protein